MLYAKKDLEKVIFFDVETVPKYHSIEDLEENGLPGEIEKIQRLALSQKLEYNDPEVIASAGLIPELNQIVCISFGTLVFDRDQDGKLLNTYQTKIKSYSSITDESKILDDSFKAFNNTDFTLGGYNIIGFDMPLVQKHYLQRGELPKNLQTLGLKPWEIKVLDLSVDWKFTSQYMISLSLLCDFLGVKNPKQGTVKGENIFSLLQRGELTTTELEVYCEEDVRSLIACCVKLSK